MNLPFTGLREHLLCDVDFNPLLSKCDTAHGVAQLWLGLTLVHPPPDGRGPGDGPTPLFHGVAIEGVNVPSHHDVKVVLTGGFHWKILAHAPIHLNLGGVEWEHAARAAEQQCTRCCRDSLLGHKHETKDRLFKQSHSKQLQRRDILTSKVSLSARTGLHMVQFISTDEGDRKVTKTSSVVKPFASVYELSCSHR